MSRVIDRFMDDVRERAKVRPAITPAHIEYIETALRNLYQAADDSPKYQRAWDDVVKIISRRDKSVAERLSGLGPIGDALQEQWRREHRKD
jgi:hypothetical protein